MCVFFCIVVAVAVVIAVVSGVGVDSAIYLQLPHPTLGTTLIVAIFWNEILNRPKQRYWDNAASIFTLNLCSLHWTSRHQIGLYSMYVKGYFEWKQRND